MKENGKKHIDVYQLVTDRIVDALEKGVVPWQKPWRDVGLPKNLITGKMYRGINLWLLMSLNYSSNSFLSFKQVKELGGKIKEGEKGNIIVFWKQISFQDPETIEQKEYPFLRYYTVFNVAQCDGLPDQSLGDTLDNLPAMTCEGIIDAMPNKPLIRHKENKAYYNPLKDFINMPLLSNFHDHEGYFGVLFHELIHSTGHQKRLNRKQLLEMAEFGSDPYSIEELTAEIGACYLKSVANFEKLSIENNASYISSWLERLKGDKKFIVFASSQAQKAADYILGIKYEFINSGETVAMLEGEGEPTF